MLKKTCKTCGFMKVIVCKIPPEWEQNHIYHMTKKVTSRLYYAFSNRKHYIFFLILEDERCVNMECFNKGVCINGTCHCIEGFFGHHCDVGKLNITFTRTTGDRHYLLSCDLSIRVSSSGVYKLLSFFTIVNKILRTVTLGWHDSTISRKYLS